MWLDSQPDDINMDEKTVEIQKEVFQQDEIVQFFFRYLSLDIKKIKSSFPEFQEILVHHWKSDIFNEFKEYVDIDDVKPSTVDKPPIYSEISTIDVESRTKSVLKEFENIIVPETEFATQKEKLDDIFSKLNQSKFEQDIVFWIVTLASFINFKSKMYSNDLTYFLSSFYYTLLAEVNTPNRFEKLEYIKENTEDSLIYVLNQTNEKKVDKTLFPNIVTPKNIFKTKLEIFEDLKNIEKMEDDGKKIDEFFTKIPKLYKNIEQNNRFTLLLEIYGNVKIKTEILKKKKNIELIVKIFESILIEEDMKNPKFNENMSLPVWSNHNLRNMLEKIDKFISDFDKIQGGGPVQFQKPELIEFSNGILDLANYRKGAPAEYVLKWLKKYKQRILNTFLLMKSFSRQTPNKPVEEIIRLADINLNRYNQTSIENEEFIKTF
jgi:hypothetical protein